MLIHVANLWCSRQHQPLPHDATITDQVRRGVSAPIVVRSVRSDQNGCHMYEIIDGLRRYKAAVKLGHVVMDCAVQDRERSYSDADEGGIMFEYASPLEQGRRLAAHPMKDLSKLAGIFGITEQHASRCLFEWHAHEVKLYKHKVPPEALLSKKPLASALELPKAPKKPPAERGLVRCLEPACKTWIKRQVPPFVAAKYFCKKHQEVTMRATKGLVGGWLSPRTISNLPLVDRDGDPIWVTRELQIIKVRHMDDDHLTNALGFLQTAARNRCKVTGVDEAKWEEKVGPRYQHLAVEAKRRDAHLKCPCDDGIVKVERSSNMPWDLDTVTEERFCASCQKGKDRADAQQLALDIAKDRKASKRMMTMRVAWAVVLTAILGAGTSGGHHFMEMVFEYLRQAGVLK